MGNMKRLRDLEQIKQLQCLLGRSAELDEAIDNLTLARNMTRSCADMTIEHLKLGFGANHLVPTRG
ncbi:MAG: hypothetical protein EOQ50_09500 [Mesorhizobium sp.]|uniref:hypothetical protein n=1 Tax=Mesorhizobium sp. TaxID=1871066 RepID=UPI000FE55F46|nr:hypothetical protein [Mesorhizobium sp.]RWB77140.1 MAG: hypothetical protein EOQ50_09500 [Mesorhizobium sp.]